MENRRILYANIFKKIVLMLTLFTVLVSCLKRDVNNILEESESDMLFEDSETFSQIKLPEFYYDNEKPYINILNKKYYLIENYNNSSSTPPLIGKDKKEILKMFAGKWKTINFAGIEVPYDYGEIEPPYEEFIEIVDPYFNFIDNLEVIIDEETIILNDIVWKYEEINIFFNKQGIDTKYIHFNLSKELKMNDIYKKSIDFDGSSNFEIIALSEDGIIKIVQTDDPKEKTILSIYDYNIKKIFNTDDMLCGVSYEIEKINI